MYIHIINIQMAMFMFSVYPDGRVCISILHAPGDDPMGYESSAERWSPVQSVEKILLSVVSMLAGTIQTKHLKIKLCLLYIIGLWSIFRYGWTSSS